MTKILHIDASARPGLGGIDLHGSYSRRLTHDFVNYWLSLEPDTHIRYRDVGLQPPEHVNHLWIEAAFGSSFEPEESARILEKSNEMVNELLWADMLVVGAPMYNFGMPSTLKSWIDNIVRLGQTLHYTPEVVEHPFTGEFAKRKFPVVLLSSRGDHGMDHDGPYAHMNHLDPAIKTALGFIGISEIYSIAIEHQSEGGDILSQSLEKSLLRTKELAEKLFAIRKI